jgi:hypothetical protein
MEEVEGRLSLLVQDEAGKEAVEALITTLKEDKAQHELLQKLLIDGKIVALAESVATLDNDGVTWIVQDAIILPRAPGSKRLRTNEWPTGVTNRVLLQTRLGSRTQLRVEGTTRLRLYQDTAADSKARFKAKAEQKHGELLADANGEQGRVVRVARTRKKPDDGEITPLIDEISIDRLLNSEEFATELQKCIDFVLDCGPTAHAKVQQRSAAALSATSICNFTCNQDNLRSPFRV